MDFDPTMFHVLNVAGIIVTGLWFGVTFGHGGHVDYTYKEKDKYRDAFINKFSDKAVQEFLKN